MVSHKAPERSSRVQHAATHHHQHARVGTAMHTMHLPEPPAVLVPQGAVAAAAGRGSTRDTSGAPAQAPLLATSTQTKVLSCCSPPRSPPTDLGLSRTPLLACHAVLPSLLSFPSQKHLLHPQPSVTAQQRTHRPGAGLGLRWR